MCGIAGAVGLGRRPVSAGDASAALSSLSHRGPDSEGSWRDDGVWLGHRRLSVIDLTPSGHQPMASGCGRFLIVFNGEIYNHGDMRREMDALGGVNWKGRSDTEVLIEAIARFGVDGALKRANGMFAIAVWDRSERTLTLARDRFGEKPLYYTAMGGGLTFASELGAIEALVGPGLQISRAALSAFFKSAYIPAPQTIYEGVFKLPPGCLLTLEEGQIPDIAPYWTLGEAVSEGRRDRFADEAEATQALDELLRDAVQQRMEADVPLGAFLSGGVDSSLVTALMQAQTGRAVKTFTAGFEDPEFNEAGHAKAVAEHIGTEHTEFHVTMADARDVVPTLGAMFDEPFADASQIPTFLISRLARQHVTVCLTGDGGDEMFGGYVRYPGVPRLWNGFQKVPMRRAVGRMLEATPMAMLEGALAGLGPVAKQFAAKGRLAPHIKRAAGWMQARSQDELYDFTMSSWADPNHLMEGDDILPGERPLSPDFDHDIEKLIWRDTVEYLPGDILCKVDRAAMASSLETRVPLLDPRIAAFAWRLPMEMKVRDGKGKWLLRQVLDRYVPRALIERPKMGFSVPLHGWLTGDLRAWAEDLLDPATVRRQGLLKPAAVAKVWRRYVGGDTSVEARVWTLLMWQSWMASRGR
ncbi:MAG TPA: asparagine synthase (glutamine-hydrolyzing) [Caulobacteraceae bacterium]